MTLPPERRRGRRISIRLQPPEFALLDSFAQRAGLTLSAFVRQLLSGSRPPRASRRPPVEKAMLARILAELGVLGERLTALLRPATTGKASALGIERDLRRTLAELRAAAAGILQALGRRGRQ